jgi:hypothetical protein
MFGNIQNVQSRPCLAFSDLKGEAKLPLTPDDRVDASTQGALDTLSKLFILFTQNATHPRTGHTTRLTRNSIVHATTDAMCFEWPYIWRV